MKCLACQADVTNGLALCERCQIAASVILEFLPVYFRNLARWRPGRAGGRPVPGSREPSSLGQGSGGDHVSGALDAAGNDIANYARMLNDDRGVELPEQDDEAVTVAALCRLFAENLTSIATLEWCGGFLREMGEHEQALRVLTERVPGLTWVTCGTCGATTYARDHLEVIIDEARGWIARPRQMAEVVVALIDTEQSVVRLYERIKKWEQRGKVTGVRRLDAEGDESGPKRYRLGDVLDRLFVEGSTQVANVEELSA
jgi:hypothetical protein